MLIDSTHRKWIITCGVLAAAAVIGHRVAAIYWPTPLYGGTFVGLWYGIAGALLILFAGLLAAHRKLPVRRWLGARKSWLKGHVWLGLLSVVFVVCHTNYSWGGVLETVLWIVFLSVLFTGIIGVLAQQLLPRVLTARVIYEAPYEQIPHLCEAMRREADALLDAACGAYEPVEVSVVNTMAAMAYASDARAQLRDFYEQDVRPFLSQRPPRGNPLTNPVQVEARFSKLRRLPEMDQFATEIDKLARFCEERRQLLEQERLHFWLHAWLLLHVPLSLALLVLGILHVVTALYY